MILRQLKVGKAVFVVMRRVLLFVGAFGVSFVRCRCFLFTLLRTGVIAIFD
jgi:hypothetical protein